jgi:opacity protein-like surface antigen
MRGVICALLVVMSAASARAGDYYPWASPWGSPQPQIPNWAGVYLGGQAGYGNGNADFSSATQSPIAYALRETTLEDEVAPSNWPVLGSATHGAAEFGGFVGYNYQIERLILGIEADYDHASMSLSAPNSPISRVTPSVGGNTYLVNITANGSVTDLDYATLRARGGWAVGNFLPYVFGGAALGHADVNITGLLYGQQNPPSNGGACLVANNPSCTPFSFPISAGKSGEWMWGFTVGAGLDVLLTQNIFLRAEYEYLQFTPVAGVVVTDNSAHAGLGVKF